MAQMINDPQIGHAVKSILEELKRGDEIHGAFPTDHGRRLAIVVEEALEVTQCALEMDRWDKVSLGGMTQEEMNARVYEVATSRYIDLHAELTQLGATVIRYLIGLEADMLRMQQRMQETGRI